MNEVLSLKGYIGALLILSGVILAEIKSKTKIYIIALNLIVLNITESAIAVSYIYIIRALSTLFTNIWSGSLVDRSNKKMSHDSTRFIFLYEPPSPSI